MRRVGRPTVVMATRAWHMTDGVVVRACASQYLRQQVLRGLARLIRAAMTVRAVWPRAVRWQRSGGVRVGLRGVHVLLVQALALSAQASVAREVVDRGSARRDVVEAAHRGAWRGAVEIEEGEERVGVVLAAEYVREIFLRVGAKRASDSTK